MLSGTHRIRTVIYITVRNTLQQQNKTNSPVTYKKKRLLRTVDEEQTKTKQFFTELSKTLDNKTVIHM